MFLGIAVACSGDPVRSYCEALCDWAVACAETERPVDAAALLEECLAETRASDGSCENAETGSINPASKKLLEGCVNDIDAKAAALECDGFTGSFDDIKTGTPPTSCGSQADDFLATYAVAQQSTFEDSESLCGRFAGGLCTRVEACVLGDFELPQTAIDALGGTPYELCLERIDPVYTSTCISADLYAPEEGLLDANIARQSARECLPTVEEVACEDLIASPPNLSPTCAAAFSSPDDLLAVGTALLSVSDDVLPYVTQ
jgi:hypothetical protein